MSTKRNLTMVGSAAAAAVGVRSLRRCRRRARAAGAVEGIAGTILPTAADRVRPPGDGLLPGDAHAPGHAHLDRAAIRAERRPPLVGARPFAKHRRGLRHPGRL